MTFATIFLCLLAGILLLQGFLSKTPSQWPGLILPAISLLFSFVILLNLAQVNQPNVWLMIGGTLFFANLPTGIFLIIYFCCRQKYNALAQLQKMNIQDLH